jgi:hypothetical protein
VVERVNPVGLLGMVLALEGISVRVASEAAVNLERNLGLPRRAFSYLSSHGSLDVSHMEFYATLVSRPDTQRDRDCVIQCARRFFTLYGNVFEERPLSLNEHALATALWASIYLAIWHRLRRAPAHTTVRFAVSRVSCACARVDSAHGGA